MVADTFTILPPMPLPDTKQDDCGDWVAALCPYGEEGCPDNEGDYDIVMPEPMLGTSGGGYKVRVVDVHDEEDGDCSDEFFLLASNEAPKVGDTNGPSLVVTTPAAGDIAEACEEYTVEVSTYIHVEGVWAGIMEQAGTSVMREGLILFGW